MADLFIAGLETALQNAEMIAIGLGGPVESGIGHLHRAGEIIGETDPEQAPSLGAGQIDLVTQAVEKVGLFQARQHDRHVKAA